MFKQWRLNAPIQTNLIAIQHVQTEFLEMMFHLRCLVFRPRHNCFKHTKVVQRKRASTRMKQRVNNMQCIFCHAIPYLSLSLNNLRISYLPLAFSIRNNVLKWDLVDLKWWIEFFVWIAKNVFGFVWINYSTLCAPRKPTTEVAAAASAPAERNNSIKNGRIKRAYLQKCFEWKFTNYSRTIHHQ